MRPNSETDAVVGDGAAGLGGTRSARDVVGRRGLTQDRGGAEEGRGWLGAGEGIFQVVLMGVGIGNG